MRITLGTRCKQGKRCPPILGSGTLKTIPNPLAHAYIANIWEYNPRGICARFEE